MYYNFCATGAELEAASKALDRHLPTGLEASGIRATCGIVNSKTDCYCHSPLISHLLAIAALPETHTDGLAFTRHYELLNRERMGNHENILKEISAGMAEGGTELGCRELVEVVQPHHIKHHKLGYRVTVLLPTGSDLIVQLGEEMGARKEVYSPRMLMPSPFRKC
ncbi:hypothetical protein P7K49_006923 [Saguinus oedipus]|uniref:Uncharacterized protein n=1 Tax=Saguinus oedipus TaxID=9490 RepID=A0ABQ9W3T1_SAGOE|nr:hypothetical protein P7K49_006923 [Saguinus oedipus]